MRLRRSAPLVSRLGAMGKLRGICVGWCGLALILSACSNDSGAGSTQEVIDPSELPVVDLLTSIDPLIGTGGGAFAQGQVFIGSQVPFGMVRPGPDTSGYMGDQGFAHTAGYWYLDDTIEGFSQLHLHGTGAEDLGNFLVMPTLGMRAEQTRKVGYQRPFRHETETTEPGYYAVTLDEIDVRAELTASTHSAVHRYTFPTGTATPGLLVDFGHGIGIEEAPDANVNIDPATGEITGWMMNAGRITGEDAAFQVYVAASFDPAPASVGVWSGDEFTPGGVTASGGASGAFLTFPAGTEQVVTHFGVSLVDIELARKNRGETDTRGFDAVRAAASEAWRDALARVQVKGGTREAQRMLASGLFHSMLMPTQLSESDRRYVGLDRQVHQADDFVYYTDFSLWDTYRTLHPLLIWIAPDHQRDMAKSLLAMAEHHGAPPRWPLWVNEKGMMLGAPAAIVLSETVLKGIDDLDTTQLYDAVIADADLVEGHTIRGDFRHCLEFGYCPADRMDRSVAKSVEFGWADFAINQLATHLGKTEDAARFAERARFWAKHFDRETGFLWGRNTDGAWASSRLNNLGWTDDYAEGTAWQYLWAAPFDFGELARQFGGKADLLAKLTEFFELAEATPRVGLAPDDGVFGWEKYYWHGNEPDIHAAYLFAMAGDHDQTAKWVDWVRRARYSDDEKGLSGNDDGGTLSAWYVFSSIGLYPLAGSDIYVIGSPVFGEVTLRLEGGDLVVTAHNAGPGNIYVQSAKLNGEPLERAMLRHAEIAQGGELEFVMGPSPRGWAQGDVFGPLD